MHVFKYCIHQKEIMLVRMTTIKTAGEKGIENEEKAISQSHM